MQETKDSSTYKNATVDAQGESSLSFSQDSRINTYKAALADKKFIEGDKSTRFGITCDFNHLEFMLATGVHNRVIMKHMQVNHAQGLYAFWAELMQYLGPLLKKFRGVSESYISLIDDDSDLLTNMANMKIKLDLHEEYIEKHMSTIDRCEFNIWYKKMRKPLLMRRSRELGPMRNFNKKSRIRLRKLLI